MNFARFRTLAAPLLALALAGCAADASRTYGSSYPSYDPTLPRQVRAAGPLPVTLDGSPFPAAEIVAALNATPNMYDLIFVPDATPAQAGYRITLNFTANTSSPCNSASASSMPFDAGPSTIGVVAAFCRSGGLLSRTTGMAPRPARADDPAFRRFMSDLIVELMPAYKPYGVENGDCPNRPNC
jgi:hypothetical protein